MVIFIFEEISSYAHATGKEMVEKQTGEGEWVFSARLEVEYLNERYELGITESEEYDTLAGYIISAYGRIPQEGEELRAEKFEIKILKREQSRLDLVSLKRL